MIDERFCRPSFTVFPPWSCPACGVDTLKFDKSDVRRWPHRGIVHGIDEGHLERGEDSGVFTAILKCGNSYCSQGVAVLGDYSNSIVDYNSYYVECTYVVQDVSPAIRFLDVPSDLPESVGEPLSRSFALYWRDPQSCAAVIRSAIERLLDYLKILAVEGGKRLSLERRLNLLRGGPHEEIVEAAKAIKNVGNLGAHGNLVDRSKLLACYELLELEMLKLFNNDADRKKALIEKLRAKP